MHYGTQSSTIFENIRETKGKVHILQDNDRAHTTVPDITEKLARTLSQISSNENYSLEVIRHKNAIEQRGISFNSNNTETCNRGFTTEELPYSISLTKNTM